MARGVPLGDHKRRARLVRHEIDNNQGRFQEAQAIALGAAKSEKAEEAFRELLNHLFPYEMDESTIKEMKEVVEQEADKDYRVTPKK